MPGDRPLGSLAEVVPQVPAVSDLDRQRRAAGGPVGIAARPVPADDLRAGSGGQPGRERVRGALGQHVDRAAGLHVDQQRAVGMPAAQRELIHSKHGRRVHPGRVWQRADQPDQRHPARPGR